MDMTSWTIGGAVVVVILIMLRGALALGKRPSSGGRASPRLKRVQELRRRIDEKAATRDAAAKKPAPAPEPRPPEQSDDS